MGRLEGGDERGDEIRWEVLCGVVVWGELGGLVEMELNELDRVVERVVFDEGID